MPEARPTPTTEPDIAMMRATIAAQKRIIDAQSRLLVAYRTGSSRTAGAAIDALREARTALEKLHA